VTEPKPPKPVTLIVGMLSARPDLLDVAEQELAALHGPVARRSPPIEFDFTDYYEPEMGPGLKRRFVSFAEKIDPSALAPIKRFTNDLEARIAAGQDAVARPVNLDPGYICGSKLVLASCKDRSQRLYLGQGVYAEITLEFRGGEFRATEMTYRDYQSKSYIDFFTQVREDHLGG
jgi:uncharacterized protein DUF4416